MNQNNGNNKPKYFKTAKIQERKRKFVLHKAVGKLSNVLHKTNDFYIYLPKKIVKSHEWKKGDELMFIPIDSLIEAKDGDVIIRRWDNGNKKREVD